MHMSFAENTDKWGLICFKGDNGDLDGGDTVHNEYTAAYCTSTILRAPSAKHDFLRDLLVIKGIPRRHCDGTKWYSSVNRTSRDALTPYLCYISSVAAFKKQEFLQLLLQHAKRLFLFAWNTRKNFQYPTLTEHLQRSTADVRWNYRWKVPDVCGPDIWAIYLRGLCNVLPVLRPLTLPMLYVLDVHIFTAVMLNIRAFKKAPDAFDADRRNLTLKTHFSAHHTPTLLSKFAWKNYVNSSIPQISHRSWFTKPGEPPMHTLLLPILK